MHRLDRIRCERLKSMSMGHVLTMVLWSTLKPDHIYISYRFGYFLSRSVVTYISYGYHMDLLCLTKSSGQP
jgi:hypothetical protein